MRKKVIQRGSRGERLGEDRLVTAEERAFRVL